ncbi:bifunctional proline dehydrogenase/L-glutamate gamma-semialdehyde dehydrogenase PutA [Avibacterium paragallinarum]|uniref:Bifunctional protein PutA n=5 Tax=Avibacterium paragallinarum TaxID=728 RepID=A0AAE5TIP7_AVIPA|nr:bifunctional proline dehydrogenase/L-glutamate gamma-semialdehyde dehydrogenase PutA [Avibacterium paragallinarum]MEE3608625.1 bifunctional proline dehydrogenase/L-glutamate gamma-semialdehyde dehydrogenase PutA [Avibacterium paragallinarum]MEE3620705.1 bifunctional proline dehydrogenase/L-glutamate gamma-semialdehyde dehydrogenase PutA [Avibacterium paragallinarum]MEE3668660.1 bifunctional proline dehydrogenase/L-glutamate gamma-semialdehyde dehydrogenase PutA [Avibacterium paragallinarum]M
MYYQYSPLPTIEPELRKIISKHYTCPEQPAITNLLHTLNFTPQQETEIEQVTRQLITKIRSKKQKRYGVDALMHEFSLGCDEGIALMCLAEALLRIPDAQTRYALINDKLQLGNWQAHLKKSGSLFTNLASLGLMLGNKISVNLDEENLASALSRSFSRLSAPVMKTAIEKAMGILGEQFVTGETMEKALKNIQSREKMGYCFSFDMLGEAAMTMEDADRYLQDYVDAIHAVGKQSAGRSLYEANGISVKLSAIHPRYSRSQQDRLMSEIYPRLKQLFVLAKQYNIGLNIDAEEMARLEISLDLLERLLQDPDLAGFDGIGFVVQAYSKRCPYVLDYIIALNRRFQRKMMVRLVKGAYWDSEIKWAQTEGVADFPVYTRKVHTDISYLSCAKKLFAAQDVIYPQFATHNVQTLATIMQLGKGKTFEFQCLHGMGETLYDHIVGADQFNHRVRVYAPVGTYQTLLAYLVRRLLENGANSSFVHQLVDNQISVEALVEAPWKKFARFKGEPNKAIKLPTEIFPHRRNSAGFNLSNEVDLATLQHQLNQAEYGEVHSLCGVEVATALSEQGRNPAEISQSLPPVQFISPTEAEAVFKVTQTRDWQEKSVEERAAILESAAVLYEENTGLLLKLAIEEAGKTLPNAIGELREAVDFLRYYAEQIRLLASKNALAPPLGKVLCISPWNFPLAIFTGQIAAALAAGNNVIAKPAEQTSRIAYYAVKLLHQAGVPKSALQLILGASEVGAALVAQPFNAVMFTGSTEVAHLIHQQLIQREAQPVFIAETGGLNTMVVDSSALLEQVIADVLSSAFDSAGQRCSALRILLVQEDIADRLYQMLTEAMKELVIGNPEQLNTDIGPVIDEEAKANLQAYQEKVRSFSRRYFELNAPETGHFVAPAIYEVDSLAQINREVFGPILHFVRYKKAELGDYLQAINVKGYALTGGCHSRISKNVEFVEQHLECGNFYINRNIVGAVVGVQPFGGHGLSGTGPKAGGELYVQRLTKTSQYYASLLAKNTVLPSITGELNRISYKTTTILLLGQHQARLIAAYQRLQQAGFKVVVEEDNPLLNNELPDLQCLQAGQHLQKAVFVSPLSLATRQRFAENNPAIFCLYDWTNSQDLTLLYNEFSRSENISAAGGNASLMAIEEQ